MRPRRLWRGSPSCRQPPSGAAASAAARLLGGAPPGAPAAGRLATNAWLREPTPQRCTREDLSCAGTDPRWVIRVSNRGDVRQCVVGDEGYRNMHDHQDADPADRFTMRQDPQVGQPQDERHQYGQPDEQPPRVRRDASHDRPRDTGKGHANDRELGVVGELEVLESSGRGEDRDPDSDQDRIRYQRGSVRGDQSYQPASYRWLLRACIQVDLENPEPPRTAAGSLSTASSSMAPERPGDDSSREDQSGIRPTAPGGSCSLPGVLGGEARRVLRWPAPARSGATATSRGEDAGPSLYGVGVASKPSLGGHSNSFPPALGHGPASHAGPTSVRRWRTLPPPTRARPRPEPRCRKRRR